MDANAPTGFSVKVIDDDVTGVYVTWIPCADLSQAIQEQRDAKDMGGFDRALIFKDGEPWGGDDPGPTDYTLASKTVSSSDDICEYCSEPGAEVEVYIQDQVGPGLFEDRPETVMVHEDCMQDAPKDVYRQAKRAGTDDYVEEVCPDCGRPELNQDSEPDDDGVFDISCPNCGWRGKHSEYMDGFTDLAKKASGEECEWCGEGSNDEMGEVTYSEGQWMHNGCYNSYNAQNFASSSRRVARSDDMQRDVRVAEGGQTSCTNCGGTLFVVTGYGGDEIIWSHLEDTGCDEPDPVVVTGITAKTTSMKKSSWYVVDPGFNQVIDGPFNDSESAVTARATHPDEDDLWVVTEAYCRAAETEMDKMAKTAKQKLGAWEQEGAAWVNEYSEMHSGAGIYQGYITEGVAGPWLEDARTPMFTYEVAFFINPLSNEEGRPVIEGTEPSLERAQQACDAGVSQDIARMSSKASSAPS